MGLEVVTPNKGDFGAAKGGSPVLLSSLQGWSCSDFIQGILKTAPASLCLLWACHMQNISREMHPTCMEIRKLSLCLQNIQTLYVMLSLHKILSGWCEIFLFFLCFSKTF